MSFWQEVFEMLRTDFKRGLFYYAIAFAVVALGYLWLLWLGMNP